MNCPYKSTISVDEEEDQGENADEFASLEALDDVGEQASGGLKHLVSRSAGGAQWTWKKVTVMVESGAAKNVMPRSICSPKHPLKERRGPRTEEDSKEQEESTLRITGSKSCTSELLRICTQEHVTGCRRPPVSASHIIQARSDLFIGKDEAVHHEQEEGKIGAQKERERVRA